MMGFAQRRRRNLLGLLVVFAGLLAVDRVYQASLHRAEFLSGWTLFLLILLLGAHNLRKRLSMLPLGSAAEWLQWHIYIGFTVILVFLLHVGWHIPSGLLDTALALVFAIVAGSGVLGLVLSRRLPPRLTRRGEDVIFERIPGFVVQLRQRAEVLVAEAATETGSTTLAEHYRDHLADFFAGPRHIGAHLFGSGRPSFMLLHRLDALARYTNEDEREFHLRLRALVEQKDELDFHHALQAALKAWLFVHVPAVSALLVLASVHMLLAHAFTGAA